MNETSPLAALFKKITHGVYVIGVADADGVNGFTAAWVMQASFSPLLLALSINRQHSSYRMLKAGGGFTVNVLGHHQLEIARRFGAPADSDKLAGVAWRPGTTGAPILRDGVAFFDCELVSDHGVGDHVLAVGRVIDGEVLAPAIAPMTYLETGNMDGAEAIYASLDFPD